MAERREETVAASRARQRSDQGAGDDVIANKLGELTRSVLQAQSAQAAADQLAQQLRAMGATWQQLGAAAGITMQAAYQRWSPDRGGRGRAAQRRRLERLREDEARIGRSR